MGTLLTAYFLMWPLISAVVLVVICRAFLAELCETRSQDRDLV